MRLLSMHLKYNPWKVALFKAWNNITCGVVASRSLAKRARVGRLRRVLRSMCTSRNNMGRYDAPWTCTVGRHVTHCSGPLAICIALGIIQKAPAGPLRLGVGTCRYKLCGLRQVALRRLETWVNLADSVCDVRAPKTCQEWIDANRELHGILYHKQPFHIKPRSR